MGDKRRPPKAKKAVADGGRPGSREPSTPAEVIEPRWIFYADDKPRFKEEFVALGTDAIAELQRLMRRHKEGTTRSGKHFSPLGNGLYELRAKLGHDLYRVTFFRWGTHFVALSAFFKNQQKLTQAQLDLASDRRATWTDTQGATPRR